MKIIISTLLLISSALLISCSDSNASGGDQSRDDTPVGCLGYPSPSLTVEVYDSQTEEFITTAQVNINFINSEFAPEELLFDNSGMSYINQSEYIEDAQLGLVVSEPNYHTFVTRDMGFELDTSCGGNSGNNWNYLVYLCPIGTSCI